MERLEELLNLMRSEQTSRSNLLQKTVVTEAVNECVADAVCQS